MNKILLFLGIIFCSSLPAQTVFKDYADGQVYVKFTQASLKNALKENPLNMPASKTGLPAALLSKYGVTKARRPFYQAGDDAQLPYIIKLYFSKTSDVNALMADLEKIGGIEYAEKVPLMKTDLTPNDPTFPAQLTQINAQNAWNVFSGTSNITLAIVDNAIMWTHQDLVANTYVNPGEIASNGIDDDANGYVDDVNGWDVADNDNNAVPTNTLMEHGTHCAGIAGARTNNSIGIASIGWNIKVIPVKTTSDGNSTSSIDDGYGGIIYAAKANARVISCSWGGSGFSNSEQLVINYAWNKGCIIVAAAGNSSNNIQSYPGAYANVYCVASVSSVDVKSGFSNYGTWVDIAAPGENIYSTIPSAGSGTYQALSGTSMATPLVAGLAALMLSNCSYMTQTNVLNCISTSAVNIYTLAGNSSFASGNQLGAGRIDAYQAMNCSSGFLTIAPVANFFALPLNTCPNTPVNFYDSSLYLPTARSWTFQGGTPATSSLINPVVQWSTPGTYSVALNVSNLNGSNTITKISYITVAGPIALPLTEGFQAAAFLPPNWTPDNVYNDNIYWQRATGIGGFGTSTACAVFDNYNINAAGERDGMRTPKYIFSNVASARLRFDVAYARYDAFYSDTLEVKLSTDCGSSWTSIYLKGGTPLATAPDLTASTFTPTSAQWRRDTIDISALAGGQGNVMFSFINRGHYGQPIYLDNINLAFPTPTLNASVPAPVCAGSTFNFTNTSTGATTYSWSMPGGTPATSTATNPSVSFAAGGNYTITLSGTNGTTTTSITRTVNITALPALVINTPTICNGAAATLSASGAATGYTWTSGPSTATYTVSPAITTVYTVTGSSGLCLATKAATVYVTANPTISVNSPSICSGSQAVITPTGAASYTWTDGVTTSVTTVFTPTPGATKVYTVTGSNGNCSAIQTATVFVTATPTLAVNNPTICSGAMATLTASGATGYTWTGGPSTSNYAVSPAATLVYTITGNNGSCLAAKTATVFVNANPVISVNNPTICSGSQAVITPTGATSYTWTDGVTNSVTNVFSPMPAATQAYTVTGSNGNCSAMQTATVFVNSTPSLTANNASLCSGLTATLTAGGATTYSWSNGAAGSSITVNPASSAVYTVTGTTAGCTSTLPINVTVEATPTLAVASSQSLICLGGSATLSATGANTYSWIGNGGGASVTVMPSVSTTYSVVGTNTLCSSSPVFITVLVSPGLLSTGIAPSATICAGTQATLIANGFFNLYSWTAPGAVASPSVVSPANNTTYTLTASGSICTRTAVVTLYVNALPVPTIGITNASCNICANGAGTVSISGGLAPYMYQWQPTGGNQPLAYSLMPGCYTVTITDANNCAAKITTCVASGTITGIAAFNGSLSELLIYPNPAHQQVSIDYNGFLFDCKLYNNLGQLVMERYDNENSVSLPLENISKGIYMLEVKSGQQQIIKKLIVE